MGNEEAKNPDNFYMCINMIGKEMQNIVLSLNTRRPLNTQRQNNNYKNLYDYWDYFYYPNSAKYFIVLTI